MLCYRCERRARFLEGKPDCDFRYQCKNPTASIGSCYQYIPCYPVVTIPDRPGDKRPRFGPALLSSREQAVRVLEPPSVTLRAVPAQPEDGDCPEAVQMWALHMERARLDARHAQGNHSPTPLVGVPDQYEPVCPAPVDMADDEGSES
jgi:hypothetical protein